MLDVLFARTFLIVGGMLCLTAVTAKINRLFETEFEMWATMVICFLLLCLILAYSDSYPLNIALVASLSLVVGWMVGPTIEHFGTRYMLRQYLNERGIDLSRGQSVTPGQITQFESFFDKDAYHKEWQNIIFQAVMGTAAAVVTTASIVFLTGIDFEFLDGYLFICLIILIVMSLINAMVIRSKLFSLIRAYIVAVVFTLYLLYDFSRLQKHAGDESWSTAIDISVGMYLDIINLFLYLLEIVAESD